MKRHLFIGLLVLILTGITLRVLYIEELRYSLPTPVPKDYKLVPESSFIQPPIPELESKDKPLFIHFFNPECPCSKFNTEHFAEIARRYQTDANFFVVIQANTQLQKDFFAKWGLKIPYKEDIAGNIAEAYGVYSTPQAVIVDRSGKLYYRGNYNKSRYCSVKSSEFARLSLESLLRKDKLPELPLVARVAYGCELPSQSLEDQKNRFLDEFFQIF